MSSTNRKPIDLLEELALAGSGVVSGIGLAYVAIKAFSKLTSVCCTFRKFCQAEVVPISELRSLISSSSNESESESSTERLVIVRGVIEAIPSKWWSLNRNVLVSRFSREKCVAFEQTWGWLWFRDSLKVIFGLPSKLNQMESVIKIPFVLCDKLKNSDQVIVDPEGSSHSLPLKLAFLFGYGKFNGAKLTFRRHDTTGLQFLIKEKILPVGKEISVAGICSLRDGNPQIKACEEFPYFLSELTRGQMMHYLLNNCLVWFVIALSLGLLSLEAFDYAFSRNWHLWWKDCKQNWKNENEDETSGSSSVNSSHQLQEDEEYDLPVGTYVSSWWS